MAALSRRLLPRKAPALRVLARRAAACAPSCFAILRNELSFTDARAADVKRAFLVPYSCLANYLRVACGFSRCAYCHHETYCSLFSRDLVGRSHSVFWPAFGRIDRA